MAEWSSAVPPRSGYYAERAESMISGDGPTRSAIQEAQVLATLEVAAQLARLVVRLELDRTRRGR